MKTAYRIFFCHCHLKNKSFLYKKNKKKYNCKNSGEYSQSLTAAFDFEIF